MNKVLISPMTPFKVILKYQISSYFPKKWFSVCFFGCIYVHRYAYVYICTHVCLCVSVCVYVFTQASLYKSSDPAGDSIA